MANKRINNQFDKFAANHTDLIAEYDATEGTYPFDYCRHEIIDKISKMMKEYRGVDFSNTLSEALQLSIKYGDPVTDSLSSIFTGLLQDSGGVNTTQQYFNEIGDIYKRYKGENIEYCPENRDKLIALNTKMVISVAKQYQGLGLSLQELISAGNEGLVVAWDKYDPNKAQLKDNILESVEDLPETFTVSELMSVIDKHVTYGKVRQKFEDAYNEDREYSKTELIKWINKNIHNAKFSSIAMLWIKAYILIEIDNASRVVKKPKSEIYKDKEKTGTYQRECLLKLDTPIAEDTETTFADTLGMEENDQTDLDTIEAYDEYKEILNKLFEGVSARDRRVVLLSYGIGTPRAMTPREVSESQNVSLARISQLRLNALAKMRENAAKYEIDPGPLFDNCTKFR